MWSLTREKCTEYKVELLLLLFAAGYNFAHHNSFWSDVGGLKHPLAVADIIDMLTPFFVLIPLASLVLSFTNRKSMYLLFFVGSVFYIEGHGMHLAANAIARSSNDPYGTIFFFDEELGHYLWYSGFAIVVGVALTVIREYDLKLMPPLYVAALFTGLTWATNGLEGGTAIWSLLLAIVSLSYGLLRRRTDCGMLAITASAISILVLLGWGMLQGGFPQPSSLAIG